MTDQSTPWSPATSMPAAAFAIVAAAVIVADAATLPPGQTLTREGGGIEIMSMIGYLYAALVYAFAAPSPNWPVPTILVSMSLRELDADKAFTSEGLLGTRILLPDTSVWEKMLAVSVWTTLGTALAILVRGRGPRFVRDLRRGAPWAVAAAAGLLLALASKSIDGLARKLAPWGVELSDVASRSAGRLEEGLELFIPVFFVIAICSHARARELG